jgi:predicted SAM-dependent methyltransferase
MITLRDVLRFGMFHVRRMARRFIGPPWPRNADGRVLLHIGAGPLHDPRFINIDVQPFPTVHVLSDGGRLRFRSGSVDVIYASHVLEHFSHREVPAVLTAWHRVLRVGGVLLVSVPDFRTLARWYAEGRSLEELQPFIVGAQGGPFDVHKTVLDRDRLEAALRQAGFGSVADWTDADYAEYPFEDYAHHPGTRPLSLHLKARRCR